MNYLPELWIKNEDNKIPVKKEHDELLAPGEPLETVGKEERIDLVFGRDGTCGPIKEAFHWALQGCQGIEYESWEDGTHAVPQFNN